MNKKPFFEHDNEVYDIIDTVKSVLGDDVKIEYDNMMVTITCNANNGLFEIVITDYDDETLDDIDVLNTMIDSAVTVTIYRNEQLICIVNNAFSSAYKNVLATIEK